MTRDHPPSRLQSLRTYARKVLAIEVLAAIVVAGVVFAVVPRGVARSAAGDCAGRSGRASQGRPYPIVLAARGDTVFSPVDFDGRLWLAVGDRVSRSGLIGAAATELAGSMRENRY